MNVHALANHLGTHLETYALLPERVTHQYTLISNFLNILPMRLSFGYIFNIIFYIHFENLCVLPQNDIDIDTFVAEIRSFLQEKLIWLDATSQEASVV